MESQDKQLSQTQTVDVVVSKSPILSPIICSTRSGRSLFAIFRDYSDLSEDHTRIHVNGEEIEDWSVKVQGGDCVSIVQVQQDPGTLAIAAIVVSVLSAVAGYLLFQPPEGPTQDEKTNRISGPRNEAKKYDPVPVVLGERRITPAYAAKPYTNWVGDTEYLNMLLCIAQGPVSVDETELRIGETALTDYNEVQYAYVDHYNYSDYTTLLDVWNSGITQENVSTDLNYDSFITRTSSSKASNIDITVAWPQGLISKRGDHRVDGIEIQYQIGDKYYIATKPSLQGSGAIGGIFAPGTVIKYNNNYYVVNPGETSLNEGKRFNPNQQIAFESIDPNITQYLEYYDEDQNIALFSSDVPYRLNSITKWGKTSSFITVNFRFKPVNLSGNAIGGNVSIRLRKSIIPNANDRDLAQWLSLTSERDYEETNFLNTIGVGGANPDFKPAILALKIKATDQLNGVIDNLNCKTYSVVPTNWNTDWSTVDVTTEPMKVSKNPAELFRWVLQGNSSSIRVPDSKIDLTTIDTWRTRCNSEGWETSEFINYEGTLKSVLDNVAFTGRAEFSYKDGKFSVVEKIERTIPKQVFTPKNSSGLKSRREFREDYDGIKFKFQNKEYEDQVDEGTYYDPYKFNNGDPEQPKAGVTPSGIFETVEFWGVVDPVLAQRHARFMFFEKKLRREIFELETDIEALVARRGDLVRIAHDVIDVGVGQGFITQDVVSSTTFYTDETKDAIVGNTYYFQVRQVNSGTTFAEFNAVYEGGGEWTANSAQTLNKGDLAVYGEQGKESLDCIIVGVENLDDYGAKLTLVNAANEIFNEDDVSLPAYKTGLTTRADYQAPLKPTVKVSSSDLSYSQGTITVQVVPNEDEQQDIEKFSLRYRSGDTGTDIVEDDSAWIDAGVSQNGVFFISATDVRDVDFWFQAKAYTRNMTSDWSDDVTLTINGSPAENPTSFTIEEQLNTPKTPDGTYSTLLIEVEEPEDPSYLYAIAEYRRVGQEQYTLISRIGWNFPSKAEVVVFSDGSEYEIRIRSVNIFGFENSTGLTETITTTNVLDPDYTDDDPYSSLPVPNVTGLELFGQGNVTEFEGKDAKFTWRKSTLTDWINLGYEGLRGASASRIDQFFKDYQVEIWAGGELVRTEEVVDNIYTYTYEKNVEDYLTVNGTFGAWRDFEARVVVRGRNNQKSPKEAKLSVSNTAPNALQDLSINASFNTIEISYTKPEDLDFAGVDIWVETTQGFDPDLTTPTATISDNSYVASGLDQDTTYYVRLRPFDDFGKTGTNTTSEFTVTTRVIATNQTKSYTVGSGKDYASIKEALEDLSKFIPTYKPGGFTAEIVVDDTHVEPESIHIKGLNLGWITIRNVSPTSHTVITATEDFLIGVVDGAVSPVIDFSFRPTVSTSATQAIYANKSSIVKFARRDTGVGDDPLIVDGRTNLIYGIYAEQSAKIIAEEITVTGCDFPVNAYSGSEVLFTEGTVENYQTGLFADSATILAQFADFADAQVSATTYYVEAKEFAEVDVTWGTNSSTVPDNGVYAVNFSFINAENFSFGTGLTGDLVRCDDGSKVMAIGTTGSTSSADDIRATKGSIVIANGTSYTNTNITVNTLTSDGIIFQ